MLLVKCSCGCIFTIMSDNLSRRPLQCQNCRSEIPLLDISNVLESKQELETSGVSVNYIPDNAKITVTFTT